MAKARLAQQEKASADAIEAKKRREDKERERKVSLAAEKSQREEQGGGRRLGGASGASTTKRRPTSKRTSRTSSYGYNAMDPASNSSSGSRYRYGDVNIHL